jgi:TPR repeat protein
MVKPKIKPAEAEALWRRGVELEDAGDVNAAICVYLEAAKMGHPLAQSNLGNMLDDKIDPPRPREAVYWYKRAVRGGLSVAAWNLSMHYRNLGQRRWSIYWLKVANKMGNEDARVELLNLNYGDGALY